MQLPVTSLTALVLGVAYVWLSYRVTVLRRKLRVGVGSGTEKSLEQAIRVHGNFAEYVPFALLLLGLAELQGAPAWSVGALGGSLVVGRLLHAIGLTRSPGTSRGRYFGTALTFTVVFFTSLLVGGQAVRALTGA